MFGGMINMKKIHKDYLQISNQNSQIPAILWGEKSNKILIAVHGNFSDKEDTIIAIMAEIAVAQGYQVLSFDLPGHGERVDGNDESFPQTCVSDLKAVYNYAKVLADDLSLFACSIGAYFSMLAYQQFQLKQSLFLSPVVNLEQIIEEMMKSFNISEERLRLEKRIELPIDHNLYWNYYSYIKKNPLSFLGQSPIVILYGSADNMTQWELISEFAKNYQAEVEVIENGEHYFHTEQQLDAFREWAEEKLF